jgi:Flp pilus assembly protein TadG
MSRLQLFRDCVFARRGLHKATSFDRAHRRRRAAAVVELAVLLPLLAILFVFAVDFARVCYISLTLTNCAPSGGEGIAVPVG